jgi:RHS repeat-associated protein
VGIALVVIALLSGNSVLAQSGPQHDADEAPGYVNNIFHHTDVDSVNLYNGELTIPIPIGPSYPVGPKLKFQAMLTYASRVWEYGYPDDPQDSVYTPLVGDPAIGIGWTFTLGAIKPCYTHGTRFCYVAPDGSERIMEGVSSTFKPNDGSQFFLHAIDDKTDGSHGFEMWDGDGNTYTFGVNPNNSTDYSYAHVTGYDYTTVGSKTNYISDFDRGRDGWYLTSIEDPFGNRLWVEYQTATDRPCWTEDAGPKMRCPTGLKSWVPWKIHLPSLTTNPIQVNLNTDGSGTIKEVVFRAAGDTPATWGISHGTADLSRGWPNFPLQHATLVTITGISLPTTPASGYTFSYPASASSTLLMSEMILPTGGTVDYSWGRWSFYKSRAGSKPGTCQGKIAPPVGFDYVRSSGRGFSPSQPEEDLQPQISGNDCTSANQGTWLDQFTNLRARKVTDNVTGAVYETDYVQYAFAYGEQGDHSHDTYGPQTLTIVFPPAANGSSPTAIATLFQTARLGTDGGSAGDAGGADLRVATFDHDLPTFSDSGFSTPLCSSAADTLCVTHAARVVSRSFEWDNNTIECCNRRLQSETTCYGSATASGTCSVSETKAVNYLLTSTCGTNHNTACTWEFTNGRHYNEEDVTVNPGGATRSTVTRWTPQGWTSVPATVALPNLYDRRTVTLGSSSFDQYFYFDASTGFMQGAITWDSSGGQVLERCLTADGSGNISQELTSIQSSGPPLSNGEPWATSPCASLSASSEGDGITFAKQFTYQNGQLTNGKWMNAGSALAWPFLDKTRDPTTGWITTSTDTAGIGTSYSYDSVGRLTQIAPTGETATFVCYPGTRETAAYRATSQLASCPTIGNELTMLTWQHLDYDGLGRLVREERQVTGVGSTNLAKRYTKYDGQSHDYFSSEWLTCTSTPCQTGDESITAAVGTACTLNSGTYTANRPSAAKGTYQLCYDPLGRAGQIVGSSNSSLLTIDRSGGVPTQQYRDTTEAATIWCVNGTLNTASPWCSGSGANSTTTTTLDLFGRITSVTEPTIDVTNYTYDVNDRLLSVSQGSQGRSFTYNKLGLLTNETSPERGSVDFTSIGSLGNVLQEKNPASLYINRKFDAAGRVTKIDDGTNTYVVNCYDGNALCGDTALLNYAGSSGSKPAGKLSRRYGYNWIPTAGPIVDDQFDYNDPGSGTRTGKLSTQTTAVGNGDLSATATQSWPTYNNLGLIAQYNHPRTSGTFPVSYTYTMGLPTTVSTTSPSQTIATTVKYNPAGGVQNWTAGNTGIITTITPDTTGLPRPSKIEAKQTATLKFGTGTYSYDAAGNVLGVASGSDGCSATFGYDFLSRITSASLCGETASSFRYDRWANLLTNRTISYTMDSTHNEITSCTPTCGTPVYDVRGNLTYFNGDTMTFDSLDRQTRNQNASSDWVYLYNGAGERVVKFGGSAYVLRREMARYIAEANLPVKSGWSPLPPACPSAFPGDVPCSPADPDVKYINQLAAKGVAAGCGGTNFCPNSTLTRAQMAVFVVKAYKPAGFTPPACQGVFADVTCSGPYASFAPWIEQLAADQVTAGCGGGNFCPGDNVREWQILVWLAKVPGTGTGVSWAAYHPVPRGATNGATYYTFRDEHSHVATELQGGNALDSTSANLSVIRDNMFLGNLLIGFYDQSLSPADWWFSVSDHLGSVRYSFNKALTKTDSHKYWPYGEDTNVTPPTQKLSFALMERNDGATRFYDHARHHDYKLGRFLGTDKVRGWQHNPQSWNRYAYVLGNPMRLTDPAGLTSCSSQGGSSDWEHQNTAPLCHDFTGGTAEQRAEAYKQQEALRQSLTPATRAFFQENFGIDIALELTPFHGATFDLVHGLPDLVGYYKSRVALLNLDQPLFAGDSTLFKAALIHESAHWARESRSLWQSLTHLFSVDVDADARAKIEMRFQLTAPAAQFIARQHSLTQMEGYAAEVYQFGDIPTLMLSK